MRYVRSEQEDSVHTRALRCFLVSGFHHAFPCGLVLPTIMCFFSVFGCVGVVQGCGPARSSSVISHRFYAGIIVKIVYRGQRDLPLRQLLVVRRSNRRVRSNDMQTCLVQVSVDLNSPDRLVKFGISSPKALAFR